MRVRLRVTPPEGSPFQSELDGPIVHLGRDPEADLPFSGPGSDTVSWRHALLELTDGGVFLTDTGSSNGTFLDGSEERLARVRLDPGDSFRLGQTGPRVTVLGVEADPPPEEPLLLTPVRRAPAPAPQPLPLDDRPAPPERQGLPVGAVVGGAVVLLAAIGLTVWIAWPKKAPSPQPAPQVEVAERPGEKPAEAVAAPADVRPKEKEKEPAPAVAPVRPKPPEPKPIAPEPKVEKPAGEVRAVGAFVAPKDAPPALLIQRRHDPEPWGRLRDGDRVDTDYHLVSLPGYRSRVHVDAGLRLTLWGNTPQFSSVPPVFESAVTLAPPTPGFDLEVVLERGRIHLMKTKDGDKRVRVRFLDETWDVTLSDPGTEVVVELWGMDLPAGTPAGVEGPVTWANLFARGGSGSVKANGSEQKFSQPSQLIWTSQARGAALQPLRGALAWWSEQLDPRANREVGLAMLALLDYHEALSKDDDLVDAVLTRVKESPDPAVRTLGVSFLAAMDALPHLLGLLESRHADVRGATGAALRRWVGRGPDQRAELLRGLQSRGGYSREKADTILRLVRGVPRSEARTPDGFATLVGYLTHDNLAIRELALQNLEMLAPEVSRAIPYNPEGNAEARRKAADAWKQRGPAAVGGK